jgi:hypothetical protein
VVDREIAQRMSGYFNDQADCDGGQQQPSERAIHNWTAYGEERHSTAPSIYTGFQICECC